MRLFVDEPFNCFVVEESPTDLSEILDMLKQIKVVNLLGTAPSPKSFLKWYGDQPKDSKPIHLLLHNLKTPDWEGHQSIPLLHLPGMANANLLVFSRGYYILAYHELGKHHRASYCRKEIAILKDTVEKMVCFKHTQLDKLDALKWHYQCQENSWKLQDAPFWREQLTPLEYKVLRNTKPGMKIKDLCQTLKVGRTTLMNARKRLNEKLGGKDGLPSPIGSIQKPKA